jgi:hypothetical protein
MGWDNPIETVSIESSDHRLGRSARFVDLVLNSTYAYDILWMIWLPYVCSREFADFLLIFRGKSGMCRPVAPRFL